MGRENKCVCPCDCGCDGSPGFELDNDGWCFDCNEGKHEIPPRSLLSEKYLKAIREWGDQIAELAEMKSTMIERPNGTKKWYLNGKLHREDGPAIGVLTDPSTGTWFLNGKFRKLHREDGPAIGAIQLRIAMSFS